MKKMNGAAINLMVNVQNETEEATYWDAMSAVYDDF